MPLVAEGIVARFDVDTAEAAEISLLDERPNLGLVEFGAAPFEFFHAVARLTLDHGFASSPCYEATLLALPYAAGRSNASFPSQLGQTLLQRAHLFGARVVFCHRFESGNVPLKSMNFT